MTGLGWWRIAAVALALAAAAAPARAEPQPGRLALVIANSAYTALPELPGCPLSAHAVATGLQRAGFDVTERIDPTIGAFGAALGALSRQAAATPDATVVIYFCGHAAAFDGRVFVLPATAALDRPSDVLTQGFAARSLADAAFRGSRTGLAVLDLYPAPGTPADVLSGFIASKPLGEGQFIAAALEADRATAATPVADALVAELHPPAAVGALLDNMRTVLAKSGRVSFTAAGGPGAASALMPAGPRPAMAQVNTTSAPPVLPSFAAPAPPALATFPEEELYTREDRKTVQAALIRVGYYAGTADGLFGPETRAAIRRYQHEIGAEMTGVLTAQQAARLVAGQAQGR